MNCFSDIFRCVSKKRSVIISPSQTNLIDLPELVLETILENLDFHSILSLRKVCHNLRDFIDEIKPSSHLTTILIHVQSKLISVELHFPSGPKSYNGYQTLYIDFHKTKNGCRLECYKGMRFKVNRVKKFLENEDFVKTAMNHLKVLMNHQKTVLETFRLDIQYYNDPANEFDRKMEPIAEDVLKGFKEVLEPRRLPIQVGHFQMTVVRQDQVAQILPFVDSKVLENIEIRSKKEHPIYSFGIDKLEKLDQWKQAKELKIWRQRSISPSPIILIDLPELVLENILEYLDFHSILTLRKVCHRFLDFIDHIKPSSHLTTIFINVQSKLISLELYFPSGSKSFNGAQIFHIEYPQNENGSFLKYYRKRKLMKKFLENENFVETAMNDLKTLMNHQKSILKTFRLEFEYYNNPAQDFDRNLEPISEKVLERIKKILKSRTSPIQVDDFQMTVIRQEQVAQILSLVNSKKLRKIEISGKKSFPMDSFEINELEKLEQWKQAKDLKIWRFDVLAPFEKLTRFRNVELFIQNVSVESILKLKEIYKDCPTIEHFNIKFKFIDDHQLLIDSLGPETTKNEENGVIELQWLYRIPVSQKFLWLSFFSSCFITFKVVKRSELLRIFRPLEL